MTPLVSELADRAETCTGIFQLAAGRYARFCDILETEAEGAPRRTATPTARARPSRSADSRPGASGRGWPRR